MKDKLMSEILSTLDEYNLDVPSSMDCVLGVVAIMLSACKYDNAKMDNFFLYANEFIKNYKIKYEEFSSRMKDSKPSIKNPLEEDDNGDRGK